MITVNAMGEACPLPVIKTKKAISERGTESDVEVLVDNETAVQNVMKMAKSQGGEVTDEKLGEGRYMVRIHFGEAALAKEQEAEEDGSAVTGEAVVVIASDRMGEGKKDLGKVLMKCFLFAVTQLEELPKAILFYNGGATLTAEGSDSLEDLKNLEAQGVEILTCGTCLDYYELKEKLSVGSVTNMYTIVEMMNQASKIIRP